MWHDIEQNDEDWDLLRVGLITSSCLPKVMANYDNAFGEPAKKYASDIALGQITGQVAADNYSNDHMQRGHIEEPIAIAEYESRYFTEVTKGGFYAVGDTGGSPDGRVGKDGLIEVKSAIPSIHHARIKRQSFDPAYKWQCFGNLKISARAWLDFISYCADYPEDKKIYVYRLHAADYAKEFKMIDTRLDKFRKLIEEARVTILESDYSLIDTRREG